MRQFLVEGVHPSVVVLFVVTVGALILSVTTRTVMSYLQDIDEQLKEEREEMMLSMWLSCHTQDEIADTVGVSQPTVVEFLQKLSETEELPKSIKSAISHDTDFKAQIYSIWNFAKATSSAWN